ncbi:MAG: hypothetical protein PUA95_03365 [Lactimicrobium massiliense]|nr:hypothetical protein [Lactimicrobium massiliense]
MPYSVTCSQPHPITANFSRATNYNGIMDRGQLESYKYFESNIRALHESVKQAETYKTSWLPPALILKIDRVIQQDTDEIARYEQAKSEVETFINGIDDDEIKQIMIARYIKAMKWEKVTEKVLGPYYSPLAAAVKCKRYLKKHGIV